MLVIGDVHGCCDELVQLIEEVKSERGLIEENELMVVIVGDLINKGKNQFIILSFIIFYKNIGPKSKEVIDYVLQSSFIICIRGNHEDSIISDYLKFVIGTSWRIKKRNKHKKKQKRRFFFFFLVSIKFVIYIGEMRRMMN